MTTAQSSTSSTSSTSSAQPVASHHAARSRDLTSWWKRFNMRLKRDEEKGARCPVPASVSPAHAERASADVGEAHRAAAAASAATATVPVAPDANSHGSWNGDHDLPGHGLEPRMIFGVPLQESIKYANVAISLTNADGRSFIYGYVPIVVAKCGVFLKEKATDVEGIFRLSGSSKRIKDLQTIFNAPDRYGKGLDWTGFTVHDAANILRRYLNQLPEPIIPLEFYEKFRDPLRTRMTPALWDKEARAPEALEVIRVYQQAITELPPLNRQLLLYILDLLAVFASKSDLNRMTSANLAAIFQPGMLSHPAHDMRPDEYRLSQDVLVFLIENQDHFLIGMRGTAADEATVRDVQAGATAPAPTPGPAPGATAVALAPAPLPARAPSTLPRSPSGGSAGGDSPRRFSGLRRNLSVSSKRSAGATSPGTPGANGAWSGSGVHRSNTVPSKKSPALTSHRFSKSSHPSTPTSAAHPPPTDGALTFPSTLPSSGLSVDGVSAVGMHGGARELAGADLDALGVMTYDSAAAAAPAAPAPVHPSTYPHVLTSIPGPSLTDGRLSPLGPMTTTAGDVSSRESLLLEAPGSSSGAARSSSPSATPAAKERHFTSLFSRSPTSDGERRDARPPNKLRKKRMPNGSAHSSTHSLTEM